MADKNYTALDAGVICGTYARQPVVLQSGQGATCQDENGKSYIDFTAGIGVNSLGFAYEPWVKAISAQAASLAHISNLYYTKPQVDAAAKLCEKTGCAKVLFCNSGAEANEAALKAARKYGLQHKGGCDIVALDNAFHGRTMGALAATPRPKYQEPFGPMLAGFAFAQAGSIESLQAAVTDKTCAVWIELVQGEGGVLPMDKSYVQQAAAFCAANGLLLLVDEVQTGAGRTGSFLACEQYGITPDIVTLAKGLGGGLPVGAALFFGKAADILQPGDHGTTFGGNPVVLAGVNVVLDTLTPAFLAGVQQKGEALQKALTGFAGVQEVTGLGLMLGLRLAKPDKLGEVVSACREKGLLVLTAQDRLRLLPPLTITEEETAAGLAILKQALQEVQA